MLSLASVVLGSSTRRVGGALLPVLGRPVSAANQVAKSFGRFVRASSQTVSRADYPKAVECLKDGLDELLTCFAIILKERNRARSTNAIERRFREVQRRTHPMGARFLLTRTF
jgi:transposase-like protein